MTTSDIHLADDVLDLCIDDVDVAQHFVEYVAKRGNEWCVVSHTDPTRTFGCYDTKEEAEKRLRQILYFKHKKEEFNFEKA